MTVYEERQKQKDLIKRYRIKAKELASLSDLELSVPDHPSTKPMADGCFVEMLIWIPKEHIE